MQEVCIDFREVLPTQYFRDWQDQDPFILTPDSLHILVMAIKAEPEITVEWMKAKFMEYGQFMPVSGNQYFKEVENNNEVLDKRCLEFPETEDE